MLAKFYHQQNGYLAYSKKVFGYNFFPQYWVLIQTGHLIQPWVLTGHLQYICIYIYIYI